VTRSSIPGTANAIKVQIGARSAPRHGYTPRDTGRMGDLAFALIADRECAPTSIPSRIFDQLQPARGLSSLLRDLDEDGTGTTESDDCLLFAKTHIMSQIADTARRASRRLARRDCRAPASLSSIGLGGVLVSPNDDLRQARLGADGSFNPSDQQNRRERHAVKKTAMLASANETIWLRGCLLRKPRGARSPATTPSLVRKARPRQSASRHPTDFRPSAIAAKPSVGCRILWWAGA
jgi:hypothetical protein